MLNWRTSKYKEGIFECYQYEKIEYCDPLTEQEAEEYLKGLMCEVDRDWETYFNILNFS